MSGEVKFVNYNTRCKGKANYMRARLTNVQGCSFEDRALGRCCFKMFNYM